MSSNRLRLFLVDDHLLVRVGLKTVLGRFADIEIIGEAGTVETAIQECLRLQPDVVLLDLRLPDGSGLEVCKKVRPSCNSTRFLVLTSFADESLVLEAIAMGVDGYLLKNIDDSEKLVHAIKRVAAGETVSDPALTDRLFSRLKQISGSAGEGPGQLLSPQERRVLKGVAQGKTNKEIGLELGLSDKTVKHYLSNVFEKLKINRRSQAAAFFVQTHPGTAAS